MWSATYHTAKDEIQDRLNGSAVQQLAEDKCAESAARLFLGLEALNLLRLIATGPEAGCQMLGPPGSLFKNERRLKDMIEMEEKILNTLKKRGSTLVKYRVGFGTPEKSVCLATIPGWHEVLANNVVVCCFKALTACARDRHSLLSQRLPPPPRRSQQLSDSEPESAVGRLQRCVKNAPLDFKHLVFVDGPLNSKKDESSGTMITRYIVWEAFAMARAQASCLSLQLTLLFE